jgi:hypothetical protein
MDAIIERMSGGCPGHPFLEIVQNDDLDRVPLPLKRHRTGYWSEGTTIPLPCQRLERLPATTGFEVSTYGRIWVLTRGSGHTGVRFDGSVP